MYCFNAMVLCVAIISDCWVRRSDVSLYHALYENVMCCVAMDKATTPTYTFRLLLQDFQFWFPIWIFDDSSVCGYADITSILQKYIDWKILVTLVASAINWIEKRLDNITHNIISLLRFNKIHANFAIIFIWELCSSYRENRKTTGGMLANVIYIHTF